MEFEEINDMAIIAVQRKGMNSFRENSIKKIKNLKHRQKIEKCITENIIVLMYLADKHRINLEDTLLNKIEALNRK